MTPDQRKVLAALDAVGTDYCLPFNALSSDTGLDRKVVRRACRALARKGLAHFKSGLWAEDGELAGSGYGITEAGRASLSNGENHDKA